ncbi:response regulator transcription factor [Sphingomonas nostoxanthinifaciens]|uniref:response regulator transcription factor n=1 Tax=Sphingomonas nostoxanthinifaciens TaxID=2872652 RepID=UPI001CC1D763|nr:response regulator transcription factor [Sphingomonas nostoxanthinifaciens]UAK23928.1 response regulator transcription factor [Sphingomonas nostoxanthinifaciens]
MSTGSHLLIVDDDPEIRSLLATELRKAGFSVAVAGNGVAMRREIERGGIDLVILDLNLPGEDGLALCRALRATSELPVIMLTARGDPIDRILGLEMGADDYVAKPFEPRELAARIRNVLKRSQSLPVNLEPLAAKGARFAGWTLDFEHRQIIDATGRVTVLSGTEFRLLRLFVEYANRVLSREQLLALGAVKQSEANDRAIDLQVSRLRARFGSEGADLIRTVRYEGYVLAAAVELL